MISCNLSPRIRSDRDRIRIQAAGDEQCSRRSRTEICKSVSFRSNVTVRPTLHIKDFSDAEVYDTWYDKLELLDCKEDVKDTLFRMRIGLAVDEDQFCYHGLRPYTKEGSKRKKRNRLEAQRAVFVEQEGQSDYAVADDEAISLLYSCCTGQCQASALSEGLQLAKEVGHLNRAKPTKEEGRKKMMEFHQKHISQSRVVLVGPKQEPRLSQKMAQAA